MASLVRRILDRPALPRPTRAQRRAARDAADDRLISQWLAVNYNAPLGALWAERPLSGRRIRRALERLQAEAEGWR